MVEQPASDITPTTFGRRLHDELADFWQAVCGRWLWLMLLVALAIITLAYQFSQPYVVDVGGVDDCAYMGKTYRCPTVDDWHARETDPGDGTTYRWSKAASPIRILGLGNQPLKLTLRLSGARPDGSPPPEITLRVNGRNYRQPTTAPFSDLSLSIPRQPNQNGDLELTILPSTFQPPGDPRELGVRVDILTLATAGGFVTPDPSTIASLLLTLLLIYLMTHRAGGWRVAVAAVGLATLLIAVGLALYRLNLTLFAAPLAVALLWAGLVAGLVLLLTPRAWADRHVVGWLAAIVALAFAFRYAGQTHPQFISIDLNFHAEKLAQIARFFRGQGENFYFQSELPTGTPVPYPSAYYVLLTPFSWLLGFNKENDQLLLRFASSLCEAGATLAVFAFARHFSTIAALFAAALYAFAAAPLDLFSNGTHANIFAVAMLAATMAAAASYLAQPQPGARSTPLLTLLAFGGFALLTLLGHYGTALALGFVVAVAAVVWLVFAGEQRGRIWPLLAAFGAAVVVAYVGYYSHYHYQIGEQIANILSGGRKYYSAEFSIRFTPLELLTDTLRWQGLVTLPLGLLGAGLLARSPLPSRERSGEGARLLLLGWLLGAGLLVLTGLFDRYTVRYNVVLMPAVCIAGGVALAWLWRRNRLAAGMVLAVAVVYGGWVWGELVIRGYHEL